MTSHAQRGMALLVSLVFLLLLTLIGISSMQNATLQEKMAGSVTMRNQSFQLAEATLRIGESTVQLPSYKLDPCNPGLQCAPPAESLLVTGPGVDPKSGVKWIAAGGGFYGVQNLHSMQNAVNLPMGSSATLYRITAVGIVGNNVRSVVESIYAK